MNDCYIIIHWDEVIKQIIEDKKTYENRGIKQIINVVG